MASWQMYTLREAGAKTASAVLQKIAGLSIAHPATALIYSAIIGVVQMWAGALLRKQRLVLNSRDVMLSLLSGLFASIANVLGPVAFLYGADLAGRTFIVTMSVVPGMFLGQLLFAQSLTFAQYVSVATFILGAWAILDGPNVWSLIVHPPTWVWITLIVMFSGALNDAAKNAMSRNYDTMVNNFWVGVSTVVVSSGLFAFLFAFSPDRTIGQVTSTFLLVSIATGAIVVYMIAMGLRAYQEGAYIVLKKVLMTSSYMTGVLLVGWLFFDEPITWLRVVGLLLFVLAVLLSDKRATQFVFKTA